MTDLELIERQAIDAAINFRWEEAIKLNQQIIKQDKKNAQAYLRLGFVYLQLSELKKSITCYQKALRLLPGNQIAKQNLERLKVLETKGGKKSKGHTINLDPNLFIEVPGKTKSVSLVNLGQKNVLAMLFVRQELIINHKKRRIEVRLKSGEYIGCLPDDLSKRLILFMQAKSKYAAYIKEATLNKVTIFIKEEKKGDKVVRLISFPTNLNAGLNRLQAEDDEKISDQEVEPEHELEKLAEDLNEKEEIYLPYRSQDEEEDEEE